MGGRKINKRDVPIFVPPAGSGRPKILIEYEGMWVPPDCGIEYVPNEPFTARMVFVGLSRGRSSLRMDVEDHETKIQYGLFAASMPEVIKKMCNGQIMGRWQVTKQGANFGLVYLGDI